MLESVFNANLSNDADQRNNVRLSLLTDGEVIAIVEKFSRRAARASGSAESRVRPRVSA